MSDSSRSEFNSPCLSAQHSAIPGLIILFVVECPVVDHLLGSNSKVAADPDAILWLARVAFDLCFLGKDPYPFRKLVVQQPFQCKRRDSQRVPGVYSRTEVGLVAFSHWAISSSILYSGRPREGVGV